MLTEKQIAAKIEEIRNIISADISDFTNDSPAKQSKRKSRARDDFEYFFKQYLPNYFTSPSAKFHAEFDAYLEQREGEIVVLCSAREHAKTVRWSIAYELHQILYRQRRFIINLSETEDLAIFLNLNIRTHLEDNSRILHDFGNLRTGNWSAQEFVTKNGVKTLARGYKQPVRGLLFGPYRPDFIRIDDISSRKSAKNEYLEKEKMEWVLGECYGGMAGEGTLFWTGNILRKTSAIAQVIKEAKKPDRDIICKVYPAIFPDGKLLWKERYTKEYFEKKRRKVGTKVFENEWQQNPIEEGIYYREEWFNIFTVEEMESLWRSMEHRIIYIDPGYGNRKKTAKRRGSDKKVAVVMGKSKLGYFLFDAISRQTTLEKFGQALCDLYTNWRVPVIYYEGNFGQADIVGKYLDEQANRKGMILPRKAYYNFAAKSDRIEQGNPLAENGMLWYCEGKGDVQDVIDNLVMFPDVEFDDPADAYSGGLEILERGRIQIRAKVWR